MSTNLKKVISKFNRDRFRALTAEMSFSEYLELCYKKPQLLRNAWQMIYDMIMEKGFSTTEEYRKTYNHYNFFDDAEIPIIGLAPMKDALVKFIKGAAGGYGTERRILLLHGPVGSSKSTLCRLLKRGMERYSKTEAGAWFSFKWVNLPTGPNGIYTDSECFCPMHEQPLKLLPMEDNTRQAVMEELNKIHEEQALDEKKNDLYTLKCNDQLDPLCKKFMNSLLKLYDGDLEQVLEKHIRVIRKVYSEADRCGIATFQPKDEKNQDSTELTGDINFRQIGNFGSDSDPRAFSFDGEFCFPSGTPVRMADGSEKAIELVNVEDEVISHLGNSRKVLNTFNRKYSGSLITLHVSGFPFPLTMTKDHPVAVIAGRCNWRWQPGQLAWIPAEDLKNGDRVLIGWKKDVGVRPILDMVSFLEKEKYSIEEDRVRLSVGEKKNAIKRFVPVCPSLARLFGLYLAEGCCTNKKVVFNLAAKEENLALEIIALVKGLFGVNASTRLVNSRKTGRLVEINNVNLVRVFKEIIPGLAASKRVPKIFMNSDEQVKIALLLGWLDGDGHKRIRKVAGKPAVRITGTSISKELARDMTVLSFSCGLVSATSKRGAYANHKEAYQVDISGRKAVGLVPELFEQAKNAGIKFWKKDNNLTEFGYARKIKNIEIKEVSNFPVYDFEVEEDHSFLANDIVVHNCVGNRGIIEFIEALKLDTAFLYDLLGASQEQSIKPKKFSQVSVDEAIIAHTNDPEFQKLKSNQYMEAFRDRTTKIDVPYTLKWSEELKILEKDYGPGKVKQHIAPHTLEIAALFSILTRLNDDKDGKISLVEKAELYDGKLLAGWTEDSVKEMKDKYPDEGMSGGVSVRYLQDKISNCLANHHDYVNMFMVLNELRDGLEHSSLLTNKEQVGRYVTCIDSALKKLTDILKAEVQKALVGDEDAIIRLCTNYIDNVMAYIGKAKIRDQVTGQDRKPDERLMRAIEEKIQIPQTGCEDFRRQIAAFIGDLAHKGKQFHWDSNPKLKKALEMKLFEDVKDTIKLSALTVNGAAVVDKDIQEKIDAIKTRLIKQYGYNERSATDVLEFVGSIFSRGDISENDD